MDLLGKKFGKLLVVSQAATLVPKRPRWNCACECGGASTVRQDNLVCGHTRSCGCIGTTVGLQAAAAARGLRSSTVGRRHAPPTRTRSSWISMLSRCRYRKNKRYARYGGRGVTVCERWLRFENFLADMGERPADTSLDRINNDGNYEPGNCRWATRLEQAANTSKSIFLEHRGRRMPIADWSAMTGISRRAIYMRVASGWSVDEALSRETRPGKKGNSRA